MNIINSLTHQLSHVSIHPFNIAETAGTWKNHFVQLFKKIPDQIQKNQALAIAIFTVSNAVFLLLLNQIAKRLETNKEGESAFKEKLFKHLAIDIGLVGGATATFNLMLSKIFNYKLNYLVIGAISTAVVAVQYLVREWQNKNSVSAAKNIDSVSSQEQDAEAARKAKAKDAKKKKKEAQKARQAELLASQNANRNSSASPNISEIQIEDEEEDEDLDDEEETDIDPNKMPIKGSNTDPTEAPQSLSDDSSSDSNIPTLVKPNLDSNISTPGQTEADEDAKNLKLNPKTHTPVILTPPSSDDDNITSKPQIGTKAPEQSNESESAPKTPKKESAPPIGSTPEPAKSPFRHIGKTKPAIINIIQQVGGKFGAHGSIKTVTEIKQEKEEKEKVTSGGTANNESISTSESPTPGAEEKPTPGTTTTTDLKDPTSHVLLKTPEAAPASPSDGLGTSSEGPVPTVPPISKDKGDASSLGGASTDTTGLSTQAAGNSKPKPKVSAKIAEFGKKINLTGLIPGNAKPVPKITPEAAAASTSGSASSDTETTPAEPIKPKNGEKPGKINHDAAKAKSSLRNTKTRKPSRRNKSISGAVQIAASGSASISEGSPKIKKQSSADSVVKSPLELEAMFTPPDQ